MDDRSNSSTVSADQQQAPPPATMASAAAPLGGQPAPAPQPTTDSSDSAAQGDPNFWKGNGGQPPAQTDQQKQAGLFHSILQVMGGGPKVSYEVGADGNTIRHTTQRSNGDAAKMIAASALVGLFAGAKERGPGAGLRAFGAGGAATAQGAMQRDKDSRDQAQEDYKNGQSQLLHKAQIAEANSRTLLNTAEAEKYGSDALDKQVTIAAPLIEKAKDAGLYEAGGVTQQELEDGIKQGKYDPTVHLGPVDGYRTVQQPGGKPYVEATHAVLKDDQTPVPLTQEDYTRYHDAHVKGFESDVKVPGGQTVALASHGNWTQQAAANELAMARIENVRSVMKGTSFEQAIPASASSVMAMPGMQDALTRFQRYISHSGGDAYQALVDMGAEKQDPKTGAMLSNPDSKYAPTVARAFGGFDVLRAYHDKVANTSAASAAKVKTDADIDKETRNGEIGLRNAQTNKLNAEAKAEKDEPANDAASIKLIGVGKMPLTDVARLLTKKPELVNQIAEQYPDFDSSKVKSYTKTYLDFTSGKTSIALNSGGTAMKHLRDLKGINDAHPVEVRTPGTEAYNAYNNLLDTVAGELAQFYQLPKTDHSIQSMVSTLGAKFNRNAAIERQAKSMGEKFDSYEHTWKNAAPSAAYQAAMPNVDDAAKAARGTLDKDYGRSQFGVDYKFPDGSTRKVTPDQIQKAEAAKATRVK